MFLDLLKIVFPFLGGGLAGAFLNEWFRRRSGKLQSIPLIERVNRLVSSELKGFTLARITGDTQNPQLEAIRNVREYQLTLRNTATIHLQEVEIQFEFPTEDIEGWASRPAISKTAPVVVEAVVAAPWKKGFRWRIPHLPSTDSIEFSFKAVNPSSADYEVALYNTDCVVVEKSKGEPSTDKSTRAARYHVARLAFSVAAVGALGAILSLLFADNGSKLTTVNDLGCTLTIVSAYERFPGQGGSWPWTPGPWRVYHHIVNTGTKNCLVASDRLETTPVALSPGDGASRIFYSIPRPKLVTHEISFGVDGATGKARVEFYEDAGHR